MRNKTKEKRMTPQQLAQFSYETCQWWNAVFTQAKRFIDADINDHGEQPWDEKSCANSILVEKMFFITALHHAIEGLQKIDIELQRMNDNSLHSVIEAIEKVASIQDVLDLRNMNEHGLDYLIGVGDKQEEYLSTSARWTIIRGDTQEFRLGNVDIGNLLPVMKKNLSYIKEKTKEIFFANILGKSEIETGD